MSRAPHQSTLNHHDPLQVSLLGSKLAPSLAGNLLQIPRLIKRLSESTLFPLTLIQSPAGYGKTTLLAHHFERLREQGAQVAWMSVSEDDKDLLVFSAYLKAAIELAGQPVSNSHLMSRMGEITLNGALNSLLSLLDNTQNKPLYLLVDDVHHLQGSDAVRLLSMLIEHSPANLHFVLCFRGEPCLSVARQRMHGQVFDIALRDLQLSNAESVLLMRQHGVANIPDEQIHALDQRLEGWSGGLALIAMMLKRDPDQINNIMSISGERRQLSEFFLQDVLSRQPEPIRRFLLNSSVVNRLNATLCNILTQQNNGQEMLRDCESRGLFLVADDEQYWFRYHPLFAEFLRRELRKQDDSLLFALHMRASDWLVQSGDYLEGYNQALAAQNVERAAEIMDTYCEDIFSTHENAWTLVEKLPPEVTSRYPGVMLSQIWQLEIFWEFERCKVLIERTHLRLNQLEHDRLLTEERLLSLRNQLKHRELMLHMLGDDMDVVQAEAEFLIDTYKDAHALVRASLYTSLMYAHREHYRIDDVEKLNTLSLEFLKPLPNDLGYVFHSAVLGPSRLMAGRTFAALQALTTALKSAVQISGHKSPLAAMVAVLLAKVHYERDEISQARKLLDDYHEQSTVIGFVDQAIACFLTQARLLMHDGDRAAAFRTLDKADVLANEHGFERLRLFTLAERLKWLLRHGETDEVIRLGRKNGLRSSSNHVSPHPKITTRDEARALAWVRVAQAEDRLPEALNLAKLWHRHLENVDAIRSMLRWGIIIAHLSLLAGDERAAQRALRRALFQAAPCGFMRVFLDEGAWLEGLLRRQVEITVVEGEAIDAFAISLLERLEGDQTASPSKKAAVSNATNQNNPICGALSSRELDILEMVSLGLLNREIGIKLGITEGSVKWYLQQIFDKIGVRRRSQAAERARQLGIL